MLLNVAGDPRPVPPRRVPQAERRAAPWCATGVRERRRRTAAAAAPGPGCRDLRIAGGRHRRPPPSGIAVAAALVGAARRGPPVRLRRRRPGHRRSSRSCGRFRARPAARAGHQRRLTLARTSSAMWGVSRRCCAAFVDRAAAPAARRRRVRRAMPRRLRVSSRRGLLRVPVVVHEQDAPRGLANRVCVRFVRRLGGVVARHRPAGAMLTGNPVRPETSPPGPDAAAPPGADGPAARLPPSARLRRCAGPGSRHDQPRRARAVHDVLGAAAPISPVRHVCGPRDFATCPRPSSTLPSRRDCVVHELVATRSTWTASAAAWRCAAAGAGTIAELTAVGVPAVLVPLPGAPSDHQTRNAQTLVAGGRGGAPARRRCDPAAPRPGSSSESVADARPLPSRWRAATRRRPTRRGRRVSPTWSRSTPCRLRTPARPARPPRGVARAHRRRGGRGHERDRIVLVAHGPHGQRFRHQAAVGARARWPRPASTCTSATGPSTSARIRRGRVLHRDAPHERRARAAAAGIPVLHRGPALGALARDPAHDRGAAVARQDDERVDAGPAAAAAGVVAELRHRRRGQRGRHQCRVRRGRVASSRPTRATAPSCTLAAGRRW